MFAVDSYDVDRMADDGDDNLCKDNIHNSFDARKVIQFVDNYDIRVLLPYVFVRLHCVDVDRGRIWKMRRPLDSTLATTLI